MNAKLAWIHEKYNHRSETYIGGSSSQTHEIGDVYLIAEELHQLHLDEEALRETLEEQTMDEKARGKKIRQKQADDDEYFMEIGMDFNFTNENDPWDIDDSDLHLTHVLRSSSSAHVEPSPYTLNPVTIIPGPAGVVQLSNSICVEPSSSTPNTVRIISGLTGLVQRAKLQWGVVKSCSLNALGDLNVTLKDLSGTVPGTIHYKVFDVGSYENNITVGAAMILANVSVFTPKPSKHYLNITKRNVVEDRPTNFTDASSEAHKSHHKAWTRSALTLLSLLFLALKIKISKDFLKLVEEKFRSGDKALARTRMAKLTTMKFDGSKSMQQYVLDMTNTATRLKTLGMNVDDSFLV
nr:hypothetical protein [Tanacetum cinerariifolium]